MSEEEKCDIVFLLPSFFLLRMEPPSNPLTAPAPALGSSFGFNAQAKVFVPSFLGAVLPESPKNSQNNPGSSAQVKSAPQANPSKKVTIESATSSIVKPSGKPQVAVGKRAPKVDNNLTKAVPFKPPEDHLQPALIRVAASATVTKNSYATALKSEKVLLLFESFFLSCLSSL